MRFDNTFQSTQKSVCCETDISTPKCKKVKEKVVKIRELFITVLLMIMIVIVFIIGGIIQFFVGEC